MGREIGFTLVFLSTQNSKKVDKKWDISQRKLNKSETPKKVSKRLKGHYLRTDEQKFQAVHKTAFDSENGQNDPRRRPKFVPK